MPHIATLRSQYFLNPPLADLPPTFQDCRITPIIDGVEFFRQVDLALATVGTGQAPVDNAGHFVLIANWWLGSSGGHYTPTPGSLPGSGQPGITPTTPLRLDGPGGTRVLNDILDEKGQRGVDVRALGWVSFAVMDSQIAQRSGATSIAKVNTLTMRSIGELRAKPGVGNKTVLNVIAHTAGAVHSKFVVIGTPTSAVAFTGGIDFVWGRWSRPFHPGQETWHDIMAKVEGPGVQALYDLFRDMWEENLARPAKTFRYLGTPFPSYQPGTPSLPARMLPVDPTGRHHIQSLMTLPQFNYKRYNILPENPPLSFAPDGRFHYHAAMKKAISSASTYIYIEDQSFWSREILEWVNARLKDTAPSGLHVILLTSGAADPDDPDFPRAYLSNSLNRGLLHGLTPAQQARVRMFRRMGDVVPVEVAVGGAPTPVTVTIVAVTDHGPTSTVTLAETARQGGIPASRLATLRWILRRPPHDFPVVSNPALNEGDPIVCEVTNAPGPTAPTPGAHALHQQVGITVHSKTTLIDDEWAYLGSGNIMRRSLYTDVEHGVSVLDEDEQFCREYRKQLWADHFRHPTPGDFDDIHAALHAWEPAWGTPGPPPPRPAELEPIPLPLDPDEPLVGRDLERYDRYTDVDSRQPWGGLWP